MSAEHAMNTTRPGLKGVRGWLLVLVAYLLFLEPFRALLALLAVSILRGSAALETVLVTTAIVRTGTAAFSLYAAIDLLRGRANSVSVAKVYFVLMLTLGVLEVAILILVAVQPVSDPTVTGYGRGAAAIMPLAQILLSGAWLVYLEQSRRVRATFAAG